MRVVTGMSSGCRPCIRCPFCVACCRRRCTTTNRRHGTIMVSCRAAPRPADVPPVPPVLAAAAAAAAAASRPPAACWRSAPTVVPCMAAGAGVRARTRTAGTWRRYCGPPARGGAAHRRSRGPPAHVGTGHRRSRGPPARAGAARWRSPVHGGFPCVARGAGGRAGGRARGRAGAPWAAPGGGERPTVGRARGRARVRTRGSGDASGGDTWRRSHNRTWGERRLTAGACRRGGWGVGEVASGAVLRVTASGVMGLPRRFGATLANARQTENDLNDTLKTFGRT